MTIPRRPAIAPRHPNWFRIMRVFRLGDAPVQFECIAETSEPGPAAVIAAQEPTRAIVTRWDAKRVFDNHKDIKVRPAEATAAAQTTGVMGSDS